MAPGGCVRHAWHCGDDPVTGEYFNHPKVWSVRRSKELAGVFAVRIHAYTAPLINYRLVLHVYR